MSAKIITITVLVLLVLFIGSNYLNHKLSFSAGAASRDAACTQARAADKASYLGAQQQATSLAAAAQQAADSAQLVDLKSQLAESQTASLAAQKTADNATATANSLTDTLKRLRNENKDVGTWSAACLPAALLGQLHPGANAQAAGSARCAAGHSNAH